MKFYSTRNKNFSTDLREAVITGLAPDGGLYLPEVFYPFTISELKSLQKQSFSEIAFKVAERLLRGSLKEDDLSSIVNKALTFEAKLHTIKDNQHILELFHGPTLAFKDFGARFLAQMLGFFAQKSGEEFTVLVATSGDTGGAVAAGFYNTPGVKVILLYPKGRVSPLQEKQLTTFGANITALEVNGSFDDCQALVKEAFRDQELCKKVKITSANSINIARLLPQSFYYFSAYAALGCPDSLSFAVPSGNFGNLTAGVIAKRLGLPINSLVAGTNENDTIPLYLESGKYLAKKSVHTISNAMDVGDPSNIERLNVLHDNSIANLQKSIKAFRFSDQETKTLMSELYQDYNYLAEPHTAIAYGALKKLLPAQENIVAHIQLSFLRLLKMLWALMLLVLRN
jgi:threonine synthase